MTPQPTVSQSVKDAAIPTGRAVIVLTCAGIGAPLKVRIRRLLKSALSAHGLRVESVELPKDANGGNGGAV